MPEHTTNPNSTAGREFPYRLGNAAAHLSPVQAAPAVGTLHVDPDAGWQARDGEANFILAHQVANGRVPHPAGPHAELLTPAFLDRRNGVRP